MVVVADDDRYLNQTIADALALRSIGSVSVYTGIEAIPVIKDIKPDLIILDVLMPGKNGYEVCRELKEDPELAEIPIIIFTVKDQQEDRIEGLKSGAIDYIAKPFFIESLMNRIEYLFSKTR
jgi:DNA-binding response OmpR family regulator